MDSASWPPEDSGKKALPLAGYVPAGLGIYGYVPLMQNITYENISGMARF